MKAFASLAFLCAGVLSAQEVPDTLEVFPVGPELNDYLYTSIYSVRIGLNYRELESDTWTLAHGIRIYEAWSDADQALEDALREWVTRWVDPADEANRNREFNAIYQLLSNGPKSGFHGEMLLYKANRFTLQENSDGSFSIPEHAFNISNPKLPQRIPIFVQGIQTVEIVFRDAPFPHGKEYWRVTSDQATTSVPRFVLVEPEEDLILFPSNIAQNQNYGEVILSFEDGRKEEYDLSDGSKRFPEMVMLSIKREAGAMVLTVVSPPGEVVIECSTNMVDWEPIAIEPSTGLMIYEDRRENTLARCFYRAKLMEK